MRTTKRGLDLIKFFEGLRLRVYIDLAGFRTIGYGHVLKSNEDFSIISKEIAEKLLIDDVLRIERSIERLIYVPLQDNQFDALTSFTFNVGPGSLQRSTLRQKLNRKEYEDAAREFLRWVYIGGKKSRGLLLRRIAERNLFLGG